MASLRSRLTHECWIQYASSCHSSSRPCRISPAVPKKQVDQSTKSDRSRYLQGDTFKVSAVSYILPWHSSPHSCGKLRTVLIQESIIKDCNASRDGNDNCWAKHSICLTMVSDVSRVSRSVVFLVLGILIIWRKSHIVRVFSLHSLNFKTK